MYAYIMAYIYCYVTLKIIYSGTFLIPHFKIPMHSLFHLKLIHFIKHKYLVSLGATNTSVILPKFYNVDKF